MSDDGELAQRSVAATLRRVDEGWQDFRQALAAFPAEHLDQRIGEGWTRKQMLAHIAAWHELTVERLAAFARSGEMQPLAVPEDVMNARVARSAEGRTAGEVLAAADGSFRRVRQQIGYLSDEQLSAHDGWPAAVIAGNTYGHYAEHLRDFHWR